MSEPLTAHEIKLCKQGAYSAAVSGRGLIPTSDLFQEGFMWMLENQDLVELWRDQGRHGQNKLRNACRWRCLAVIARERRYRSGLQRGDIFYYSPQIIREILPDMWDVDDWVSSSVHYSSDVKVPARPSEGNNRLVMIADVRTAFNLLVKEAQELLECLYRDGGVSVDVAAAQWQVTTKTIRRREARYLDKMVESLGGLIPMYGRH